MLDIDIDVLFFPPRAAATIAAAYYFIFDMIFHLSPFTTPFSRQPPFTLR